MAYVATLGLPSLLFSSVCQLHFSSLKWEVIAAVLSAKVVLILLGCAVSWASTRSTDGTGFAYTLGGATALMATMSDDMGIGLPVFLSFWSDSPAQERGEVILHLIILSALQSAVINPVSFLLLGLGRARKSAKSFLKRPMAAPARSMSVRTSGPCSSKSSRASGRT